LAPAKRHAAPARVPTAADLEGRRWGRDGQDYAADITAKAADAMAASARYRNGQSAAGLHTWSRAPLLTKLGAAAQAMGADPATVQKLTSINPGDAEPSRRHGCAGCEAAKQVTNRVHSD